MKAVIVADIGGTHTRFGLWQDGVLSHREKMKTADFSSIPQSIAAYQKQYDLAAIRDFAFATAANPHADGIWRFTNLADRPFSLEDIEAAGYRILLAEDDFSATAYGCLSMLSGQNNAIVVKGGAGRKGDPKIVLGPGTGLGMGYGLMNADGSFRVQKVYGGHMLFTPVTEEHLDVAARIKQKRTLDRPVIFEDIACGSSFPALYDVCCEMTGAKPAARFFDDPDHPGFIKALRVFHETLGLFAHLCVVTIHGFGGVIMNGGFLDALIERDLWQKDLFLEFFHQKGVPIVEHDIINTPVSIVTDTYISLTGVGKMLHA